jgi:hypothetical protein
VLGSAREGRRGEQEKGARTFYGPRGKASLVTALADFMAALAVDPAPAVVVAAWRLVTGGPLSAVKVLVQCGREFAAEQRTHGAM